MNQRIVILSEASRGSIARGGVESLPWASPGVPGRVEPGTCCLLASPTISLCFRGILSTRARLYVDRALEPFQHIGHELPRELAREALDGRRILADKCREVSCGLVLFAENVVFVLV